MAIVKLLSYPRYMLFTDALELLQQINDQIIPVERLAQMSEFLEQLEQFYNEKWETLHILRVLTFLLFDCS